MSGVSLYSLGIWSQIPTLILRILNFKESKEFTYKWLSFQVYAWIFLHCQLIRQAALLSHHARKWKSNLRATSDFRDKQLWSFPTQSYPGFLAQDENIFTGNSFGFSFQASHANQQKHGLVSPRCKWGCRGFRRVAALPSKSWSQEQEGVTAMTCPKKTEGEWKRNLIN